MVPVIFEGMTWSYSRISSFDSCPYKFFLTYIRPQSQRPLFFSSYGSFMHGILERYYSGSLDRSELLAYYLTHFHDAVSAKPPNLKVFSNYYRDGMNYLQSFTPLPGKVLGVEKHVEFSLGGKSFQGFTDLLLDDGGRLVVTDHKARTLKPRSNRKKPTKTDEELDRYLRQLYLYSIPLREQYGRFPDELSFNCYRSGLVIREPFRETALHEAEDWALSSIRKIETSKDWPPNMDFCRCKYLCDVSHECEYCEMEFGDWRRF